jgi:nitroreductase
MDCLDAIRTRRSVRHFTEAPVTDADLDAILRAAMAAPSAGNERPWRFVVVRDADVLARLSRATPFAKPLASAPLGMVVCADRRSLRYPGLWPVDCAAAIENLLLAAHALGLGGVWMGVHPITPLQIAVGRIIHVPRRITPVAMVALGHPESMPEPVDRFDPSFIHYDRWEGSGA